MWTYNNTTNSDELYHYGVKGMKWGVRRRYLNSDGSLNAKGQKKVAKKYKNTMNKVTRSLAKKDTRMRVNAYNKAADHMNNGGIDKFNAQQRKKYGDNYTKRAGYVSDYNKQLNKLISDNYNKSVNNFLKKNKNYQKAQSLVQKYNMTKWNDLAKENESVAKKLR